MLGYVRLFYLFIFLEYIQIIMTLEESVQHVVMAAIQEVSLAQVEASACTPSPFSLLIL